MTLGTEIRYGPRPAASGMAFLQRVRARAKRRVLWTRQLWAGDENGAGQGIAISQAEVDRILVDPHSVATKECAFYERDQVARELSQEIKVADDAFARDQRWQRLRVKFELSDQELDLLTLAAALEVDPMLRRVYGYLQDDATVCHATPWMAACLFQWPGGPGLTSPSNLMRWCLARPTEGIGNPWSVTAPWLVDTGVVNWVVKGDLYDPALGTAVKFLTLTSPTSMQCGERSDRNRASSPARRRKAYARNAAMPRTWRGAGRRGCCHLAQFKDVPADCRRARRASSADGAARRRRALLA
jgi:hypothetical protein